jgi:hypothetical protein
MFFPHISTQPFMPPLFSAASISITVVTRGIFYVASMLVSLSPLSLFLFPTQTSL